MQATQTKQKKKPHFIIHSKFMTAGDAKKKRNNPEIEQKEFFH